MLDIEGSVSGRTCLVRWNIYAEIDGPWRGSPIYVCANAEGHLDEAVLRLNLKDCNVLSLPQDRIN